MLQPHDDFVQLGTTLFLPGQLRILISSVRIDPGNGRNAQRLISIWMSHYPQACNNPGLDQNRSCLRSILCALPLCCNVLFTAIFQFNIVIQCLDELHLPASDLIPAFVCADSDVLL